MTKLKDGFEGLIPACAGTTEKADVHEPEKEAHPRLRGDY